MTYMTALNWNIIITGKKGRNYTFAFNNIVPQTFPVLNVQYHSCDLWTKWKDVAAEFCGFWVA